MFVYICHVAVLSGPNTCIWGRRLCLFFKLSGTAKHPLPRSWKVALLGVYRRKICASYSRYWERRREGETETETETETENLNNPLAILSVTQDSLLSEQFCASFLIILGSAMSLAMRISISSFQNDLPVNPSRNLKTLFFSSSNFPSLSLLILLQISICKVSTIQ